MAESSKMMTQRYDICVVGGCGRVGLPLALSFARQGLRVAIHDINTAAIELLQAKKMPFLEDDADAVLESVMGVTLHVDNNPALISHSEVVIIVIGTPVDEHLNPKFLEMKNFMESLIPYLVQSQLLILRSTVYPGVSEKIHDLLAKSGLNIDVAFCPERVAEGKAMTELIKLPQIISGFGPSATERAESLFRRLGCHTLRLLPMEAELAKIFINSWRYIQFATANQFLMIATEMGVEYYRVFEAMTNEYPRMKDLPKSGFAAGPCLFKDTMQLAAAAHHNFALGHSAMIVNEGLPDFIVAQLKKSHHLATLKVGILGMAFKAESDDRRESLSYKLRKVLTYESASVVCHDPYVQDSSLHSLGEVMEADLIILGTPHEFYKSLEFHSKTRVVDVWNFFGRGINVIQMNPNSTLPVQLLK